MKIEKPDWFDGRHTLNVITAINLLIDSNNEHDKAITDLSDNEDTFSASIAKLWKRLDEHDEAISTKQTMKDLPPEVTDAVNDNIHELIDSEPDAPDSTELLPCPFCGGNAEICDGMHMRWIKCKMCGVSNHAYISDVKRSIKEWNTRENIADLARISELEVKITKLLTQNERLANSRDDAVGVCATLKDEIDQMKAAKKLSAAWAGDIKIALATEMAKNKALTEEVDLQRDFMTEIDDLTEQLERYKRFETAVITQETELRHTGHSAAAARFTDCLLTLAPLTPKGEE